MEIIFEKKHGKVDRPIGIKDQIKHLPDGFYMMTLTKGSKRNLEQNAYYWKLLTIIGNDIGYEKEELHDVFKNLFLKKTVVHEVFGEMQIIQSTTSLTVGLFQDYIEKLKNRCYQNGYEIPLQ